MDSECCKRSISYPHVSLKMQSAHDVALEEFNPVPPVKLSCQSIGHLQITESAYNADITPSGGVCSVPLVLICRHRSIVIHCLALIDFLTTYSSSFLPSTATCYSAPFPNNPSTPCNESKANKPFSATYPPLPSPWRPPSIAITLN
jgi:hypothetical protein